MTEFAVGDRVVLAAETEHGAARGRTGVVIDTSAVDLDGTPQVVVDFPWALAHVVLPSAALELVDRPADPEAPAAVIDAARELGRQLGSVGMTFLPGTAAVVGHVLAESDAMTPPEDIDKHPYEGRGDLCRLDGCEKPLPNPIHRALPPYRMRYLEDVTVGMTVFLAEPTGRWSPATVLDRRDSNDCAHLILMDEDGDQRGLAGVLHSTIPVPVESG